MKGKKYSTEDKIRILRQADGGTVGFNPVLVDLDREAADELFQ